VEQYQDFVSQVVDRAHNAPAQARLAVERPLLAPLPAVPLPEYTQLDCRVRKWSTIRVLSKTYSVPSRLIGLLVQVRLYVEQVEVYVYGQCTLRMPRIQYGDHRIDYRHVIDSLVKKPGAFARYRYREELFPSLVFRRTYDALQQAYGERADPHYVRLLHLCTQVGEARVQAVLAQRLLDQQPLDYTQVREAVQPTAAALPQVTLTPVRLADYDALLQGETP
jgi:hypothetical protein